jgi:photosystem II stability/assembly factor-like uncharacterized protein
LATSVLVTDRTRGANCWWMKLRSWIVCRAAVMALLAPLVSAVADGSAATRGGQSVQEAWVLGAGTVWAWTQDETGPIRGGGAQGIELTTDGGARWSNVTPAGLGVQGAKHWINGFFAFNADDAWVVSGGLGSGAPQSIVATTNGGRTWRVIGPKPPVCELDFVAVSDGWCAAIGGALGSESVTLYRTTDGGRTWQVASRTSPDSTSPGGLPFPGDKNIEFTTPDIGWAPFGTAVGVAPLYETENGGRSWIARNIAPPPRHTGPAPRDGYGALFAGQPVMRGRFGAVGYSIGQRGGTRTIVYLTTDAGRDWHPVVPPGPGRPWLVDTLTARSWRLVSGNRILATEDSGRTWQTIRTDHTFQAVSYSFGAPTPPVVLFTSDNMGWIVQPDSEASTNTLWRTVDGGHRWHQVTVPGT